MNAIAAAEFRLLVRNRLVAGCAVLFPFAFAAAFYLTRDPHRGGGSVAGVQVVTMAAMGTYVTATTTLATRRQTLYLKRLRAATIADRSIIAGLVAPLIAVNLAQIAIVLAILASTGAPANPALVIAAIAITQAMFTALALATAGFTASPEQAQYTTMPLFFTATAAAIWTQAPGANNLAALTRALPGGASTELIMTAWNGGSLSHVPLLLAPSLAWAALGILAARAFFRWEPRRYGPGPTAHRPELCARWPAPPPRPRSCRSSPSCSSPSAASVSSSSRCPLPTPQRNTFGQIICSARPRRRWWLSGTGALQGDEPTADGFSRAARARVPSRRPSHRRSTWSGVTFTSACAPDRCVLAPAPR